MTNSPTLVADQAGQPGRRVALLLPGQGSQHHRMAAGLYPHEPVFAEAFDEVLDAYGEHGPRLRADWTADRPSVPLDHVTRSQPLLFAVDYALGRLALSWGVRPAALLGHSVGEMAAAVLADVFDVADAARLMLDRVSRLALAPPGGMLAVAASAGELEPFLGDGVAIGAVNAPLHTVLAGPEGPLAAAAERMTAAGIVFRRVPSMSAFHSPAVRPALSGSEEAVAAVAANPPRTVVYSGYTAAPLEAAEAQKPSFWAAQPAEPVFFWAALNALLATGPLVLLEAGPGQGLSAIARRHPDVRTGRSTVVPLLPARPGEAAADRTAVRSALRTLSADGHAPTPP
ncbi:acyltransferase domain-containing protein [Streptomyces inhibens]|uniref:acyltransferase domain-containing protein n=1 Tax=Streptomyces inhibens TaxID=2293571 RepID=UPI00247A890B|nr:acyltransferase domain-containing protein [Streptomyces inhibens]UKY51767.1 acyltransferase domain-containing protein [Streptomyces inhibens]